MYNRYIIDIVYIYIYIIDIVYTISMYIYIKYYILHVFQDGSSMLFPQDLPVSSSSAFLVGLRYKVMVISHQKGTNMPLL